MFWCVSVSREGWGWWVLLTALYIQVEEVYVCDRMHTYSAYMWAMERHRCCDELLYALMYALLYRSDGTCLYRDGDRVTARHVTARRDGMR